jgi:hypothetical protein
MTQTQIARKSFDCLRGIVSLMNCLTDFLIGTFGKMASIYHSYDLLFATGLKDTHSQSMDTRIVCTIATY